MNKLEEEFKDLIYLNSSKDDGKYFLNLAQLDEVGEQSAKMIKTKQHICPTCHYQMDTVTSLDDQLETPPQEHDITLCLKCGEILEFQKDLSVIVIDQSTLDNLDPQTKHTLITYQNIIKKKNMLN